MFSFQPLRYFNTCIPAHVVGCASDAKDILSFTGNEISVTMKATKHFDRFQRNFTQTVLYLKRRSSLLMGNLEETVLRWRLFSSIERTMCPKRFIIHEISPHQAKAGKQTTHFLYFMFVGMVIINQMDANQ